MDNVTIIDTPLRSPEWFAARLGRLTSSTVADAFAKTKSGWSTSRANLRTRLMLERLTGQSQESGYTNAHMQRGIELEPDALAAYEMQADGLVSSVGFLSHNALMVGASPDGFVGSDGQVEIKCPTPAIHLDYMRGALPEGYRLQIIHTLWLSGRAWGDFASYCPAFPEPLRLHTSRILAKDVDFAAHELAVRMFLSEVEKEHDECLRMMAQRVA